MDEGGGPGAAPPFIAPSIRDAALKGLCPRCGAPTLFKSWLSFADRCRVCGLDFTGFDVGDGPAAFLTLIVGTVVVALAAFVEVKYAPPYWLHALLWIPLTLVGVVGSLRVAKSALMALEYRNVVRGSRFR